METLASEMGIPACLAHRHTVQGLDSLTVQIGEKSQRMVHVDWLLFVGPINIILCSLQPLCCNGSCACEGVNGQEVKGE